MRDQRGNALPFLMAEASPREANHSKAVKAQEIANCRSKDSRVVNNGGQDYDTAQGGGQKRRRQGEMGNCS